MVTVSREYGFSVEQLGSIYALQSVEIITYATIRRVYQGIDLRKSRSSNISCRQAFIYTSSGFQAEGFFKLLTRKHNFIKM